MSEGRIIGVGVLFVTVDDDEICIPGTSYIYMCILNALERPGDVFFYVRFLCAPFCCSVLSGGYTWQVVVYVFWPTFAIGSASFTPTVPGSRFWVFCFVLSFYP